MFAAPPCGACSAARNIRPGPPVLRMHRFPWGVPWSSAIDSAKLASANELYKRLATFIELCDSLQVDWCVENPTNSGLWELPCFAFAIARGVFAHCQACAFGSTRDKKTSFLCSRNAISRMGLMCPGCASHDAWGLDAEGTFNTSKEAAYPVPMCHALCDVAESIAAARDMSLGASQAILSRAHRQPQGPTASAAGV